MLQTQTNTRSCWIFKLEDVEQNVTLRHMFYLEWAFCKMIIYKLKIKTALFWPYQCLNSQCYPLNCWKLHRRGTSVRNKVIVAVVPVHWIRYRIEVVPGRAGRVSATWFATAPAREAPGDWAAGTSCFLGEIRWLPGFRQLDLISVADRVTLTRWL